MSLRKLLLVSAAMLTLGAQARQLSVSEVLTSAKSVQLASKATASRSNLTLAYTSTDDAGNALYYVFNREGGKGFLVMAADDCSQPVLADVQSGEFNYATAPEALRYILDGYSQSISKAIENGESAGVMPTADRSNVAPMLKTTWSQDAPFNNLCPDYSSQKAMVGCVALAMAQVMKYHEHPKQGVGSHSYTYNGNTYSANFGETTYKWDLMTPNGMYMGTEQDPENAISTLTYHCGVSINMMYNWEGNHGSAAYAKDVPNALITYFDYDASARFVKAADDSNFEETMYQELAAGRPIIVEGFPSAGASGHTFICHGYQASSNTFYLNLGAKGGLGDGYFALSNLAGWNYGVGAVIGIQPNTGGSTGGGETGGGTGGESTDKYATNFDGVKISNTLRALNSITVTSPSNGKQQVDVPNTVGSDLVVVDLTATNTVKVKQDEEISFSIDYTGRWMNSYVYIDANGDGFKAVVDEKGVAGTGNELVSYSNYNGVNSKGEKSNEEVVNTLPTFTIPSTLYPGTYRMRVKIDWNNVDPKGNTSTDNPLAKNGGRIVDFLLKVEESTSMVTKKYEYVHEGVTVAEKSLRLKIGDSYPVYNTLEELKSDYYTISGYPTDKVTDVNNETITLTVTATFPFKISKGASASSATWYTMAVNGNYLKYDDANPDKITFDAGSLTAPYQTNGKVANVSVWCFTGNLVSGVQIWNKKAQVPLASVVPTGDGSSVSVCADSNFDVDGKKSQFYPVKNDDKSFYLVLRDTDYMLNKAGEVTNGWLAYSTTKDAGTVVTISEVSRTLITAVDEIVADEEGDGTIYDLMGRPVENPTSGIYIRNGKKFIVR